MDPSENSSKEIGKVRVGRIVDRVNPSFEGFTSIIVMMKSHSKWFPLSPYYLKNEEGHIHENIWQFSKVYPTVPESKQRYSRYDPTVIWEWPAEDHLKEDKVLPAYFKWKQARLENKYAVRYPVGFKNRHTVKFALHYDKQLTYIEARKAIYLPEYVRLAKQEKQFKELRKQLKVGENLLIIEVDGPHHARQAGYDKRRDLVMKERGIETMRFSTDEVRSNLAAVTALISDKARRRMA